MTTERWVICKLDHLHWGTLGEAGLLLRHAPEGRAAIYLLHQRSRWIDEGGTWAPPGGALREGESPEEAARRTAREQVWPVPDYQVTAVDAEDCGAGWTFHVVRADVPKPFVAYCLQRTDAVGWFTVAEMGFLQLHPGFNPWFERQSALHPGAF